MKTYYLLLLALFLFACSEDPPPEDPGINGKYYFYHPALGYSEIVFDDTASYAYSETQKVLGSTAYQIKNDSFYNENLPGGAEIVRLSDTLILKIPLRSDTMFPLEDDVFTYHDIRKENQQDFKEFLSGFETRARLFKIQHGIYKR